MDSENSDKGKIKNFPKAKRETPDDMDAVQLVHACTENTEGMAYAIHLTGKGLVFPCLTCGHSITLDEVVESFKEV